VAADLDSLLADVAAESSDLTRMLDDAGPDAWSLPTPAAGWSVGDQIGHLWFFDREARRALADADGFVAGLAAIASDLDGYLARHLDAGRALGDELPVAFQAERSRLLAALRAADPASRVPWYGPAMSPASFATARLMETWAHGQDVADALGVRRTPTDRLRHVCHLGVRTREFSYGIRGETPPDTPVAVVVTAPSGGLWSWGDDAAADRIEGAAVDFCLVVTQRRQLADVGLRVTGDAAADWLAKAQAFAGGPTVTDSARRGLG
jgi:uncharacterized protein (TIGR03084 family)